jgi:demethylphylloquinone reductase
LADILPVWYDMMGGDYAEIRVVLVNRSNEILKGDINSRLREVAQKSLRDRTVAVELLLDAAVREIKLLGHQV